MHILIIDQCSKDKEMPENVTVLDATDLKNTTDIDALCAEQTLPVRQAKKLYTGRQQQYISQAVNKLRQKAGDTVDRYFISAGFGLVSETEKLPPYNVTFTDSTKAEIQTRSEELAIESALLELVTKKYDLIFFALGNDYYGTFDLSRVLDAIGPDTWVVCFNQELVESEYDNVISLPARTEQAKEHGTITVALKGRYLQHFATHRANGRSATDIDEVAELCTSTAQQQSDFDDFVR